jgi:hypothetical protein
MRDGILVFSASLTQLLRQNIPHPLLKKLCALLNECSQGCACLSSPWKLQDLLAKSCRQPGA